MFRPCHFHRNVPLLLSPSRRIPFSNSLRIGAAHTVAECVASLRGSGTRLACARVPSAFDTELFIAHVRPPHPPPRLSASSSQQQQQQQRPVPPTTEHVFKLEFGGFALLLVYFTDAAHVNFVEPASASSRSAGGSDLYQLNQMDDVSARQSIVDSTNHRASAAGERTLRHAWSDARQSIAHH